jgi:hypothetical protein
MSERMYECIVTEEENIFKKIFFNFFKVETRDQLAWFAGELNTGKAPHQEENKKQDSPPISQIFLCCWFWPCSPLGGE